MTTAAVLITGGRIRRRVALAAVWLAPPLLLLSITHCAVARYRISPPSPLDGDTRAALTTTVRAAFDEEVATPAALPARLAGGPLVVVAWSGGREVARVQATGETLGEAAASAGAQLAADPAIAGLTPTGRQRLRLQVAIVRGRGPLAGGRLGRALSLSPGLEGFGARLRLAGGEVREVLLLPDDLARARLLSRDRPLPFVPDLRLGFDFERADMMLAKRAALPAGVYGTAARTYFRFRADSFVERPVGARAPAAPPVPLVRGTTPGPPVTAENLRAAALAGGRYLVAHLAANGRYIYERDLATGRGTAPRVGGPYSIPRHAGTTYFLAELYRLTGAEELREPIERAFAHLEELIRAGGCERTLPDGTELACVIDGGQQVAHLGSTALTVVALAEYQRATGEARYLPLARRLTAWLAHLQQPDGSFAHLYDVDSGAIDRSDQLLYYSGEAALALARMHEITGEAAYRDRAEAALDWLVGFYDFFLGGFFYGEEHWTCIAAEALYPAVKKTAYLDFCLGYARFLRRHQFGRGDFPDHDDLTGAYNVSAFTAPQNTPAGSRTEAVISTYQLARHHGRDPGDIRAQIRAALALTLTQQLRPDNLHDVPSAARAEGGVPASPIDRTVRIDYVQHVCSAQIRAVSIVESPAQ